MSAANSLRFVQSLATTQHVPSRPLQIEFPTKPRKKLTVFNTLFNYDIVRCLFFNQPSRIKIMKNKILFIGLLLSSLMFNAHASTLFTEITRANQVKSAQQEEAKTEIFINNNSDESVWISVYGHLELLLKGFTLRLYSNEVEMEAVHIKMSKNIFSDIFFDGLVPNHSKIKVRDYLTPPASNS